MGLSQALNGSLHVGAGQNLPTRTIAPTFQASAKWLRQIQKDERLNIHLTDLAIKWQFNLRSAQRGGQLEQLICLFKNAFNKSIGNCMSRWAELEEVVIAVETSLNNRPLSYIEDVL